MDVINATRQFYKWAGSSRIEFTEFGRDVLCLSVAETLLPRRWSKHLSVPFTYKWRVWHNCYRFSTCCFFFPSVLLNFHASLQKNQISSWGLLFLIFHLYSLYYNFFLFRVIYEIIFNFIPNKVFYLSDLVLILLITIYFI